MTYDDYPDLSDKAVYRGIWRHKLAIIGLVLLIAGAVVGGKYAGWYWQGQNIKHTNTFIQHGLGAQSADLAALNTDLSAISSIRVQLATMPKAARPALRAQLFNTATDACLHASQITSGYSIGKDRAWVSANCQGAALSQSSPIVRALKNGP